MAFDLSTLTEHELTVLITRAEAQQAELIKLQMANVRQRAIDMAEAAGLTIDQIFAVHAQKHLSTAARRGQGGAASSI